MWRWRVGCGGGDSGSGNGNKGGSKCGGNGDMVVAIVVLLAMVAEEVMCGGGEVIFLHVNVYARIFTNSVRIT